MLLNPHLFIREEYEPKTGQYDGTVYAKLSIAVLEDAVLEYREIQKYKKETGDERVTDEELDLQKFFYSDWCQLLMAVVTPNLSYEWLLDRLKITKLETLCTNTK